MRSSATHNITHEPQTQPRSYLAGVDTSADSISARPIVQVLKQSKFKEHGRLTPEEFVAAGDFLSEKFGVWSWYVHLIPNLTRRSDRNLAGTG